MLLSAKSNLINNNDSRILDERAKYRIYCNCGHSIIIYPFENKNKKLCNHCGKYVYKNNLLEFKDILINKLKNKEGIVNE